MEAKHPEITLGEPICEKIKNIYHANKSWQACYKQVSEKFTILKRLMRKIYPDKDILELLREINKFDTMSYQEIFEMQHDFFKEEELKHKSDYRKKVTWVPVPIDKPELLEEIRQMLVGKIVLENNNA
jgi:hypothetical protein